VAVDLFIIATDVPGAMLNFGTPQQKLIQQMTKESADQYIRQGYFGVGSMRPKVEAAVRFVTRTGKRAVITSIKDIKQSVVSKAGTEFVIK
jgi:carbamate kinase